LLNENRHPKKAAFLAAFAETGNVTAAAAAADINRTLHYDWLEKDPEYAAAVEDARAQAVERMEREALKRAVEGWEEPVFHKGSVCGTVRKFSDTLLIFLLKGNAPHKYRERHEVTGAGGGPVNVQYKCIRGDWAENV